MATKQELEDRVAELEKENLELKKSVAPDATASDQTELLEKLASLQEENNTLKKSLHLSADELQKSKEEVKLLTELKKNDKLNSIIEAFNAKKGDEFEILDAKEAWDRFRRRELVEGDKVLVLKKA